MVSYIATAGLAPWLWSLSRASELMALVLFIGLIASGIAQIAGWSYRIMEPLPAWKLHTALALGTGISLVIHATALLLDKNAAFSVLQALNPFGPYNAPVTLSSSHTGATLAALGLVAVYAAALFCLETVYWANTKPAAWRLTLYVVTVLLAIAFLFGLHLGTRLPQGLLHLLWLGSGIVIVVGSLLRIPLGRRAV